MVPSPTPSHDPSKVTKAESKQLLREFEKAQYTELKALDHRHDLEVKELKASQAARRKEWETQTAEARHLFMKEHKGAAVRTWIKESRERHKAMIGIHADERAKRTHEYEVRRKGVKDDQAVKLKEFQEFLNKGDRPPARLWPMTST